MWLLTHTISGKLYGLFKSKRHTYTVGDKNADIELVANNTTDNSGIHAYLHIQPKKKELQLELESASISNATFISKIGEDSHKIQIKPKKPIKIANGDCIQFGKQDQNIWRCQYLSIVNCCSTLTDAQLLHITKIIQQLGGQSVTNWEMNCTHLTLHTAKITIKLMYALVQQAIIVNCHYWEDLLSGKPVSDSAEYLPSKCELLRAQNERKTLFNGLTFWFVNREQFEMYTPLIEQAGGDSKLFLLGMNKNVLIKQRVSVVQFRTGSSKKSGQGLDNIFDFITRNNRRLIPEYEIGSAIMHCSTLRYCNAEYLTVNRLTLTPSSKSLDVEMANDDSLPSTVLVRDSDLIESNESVSPLLIDSQHPLDDGEIVLESADRLNCEQEQKTTNSSNRRSNRIAVVNEQQTAINMRSTRQSAVAAALAKKAKLQAECINLDDEEEDEIVTTAAPSQRRFTRQSATSASTVSKKTSERQMNVMGAQRKRQHNAIYVDDDEDEDDSENDAAVVAMSSKRCNTRQQAATKTLKRKCSSNHQPKDDAVIEATDSDENVPLTAYVKQRRTTSPSTISSEHDDEVIVPKVKRACRLDDTDSDDDLPQTAAAAGRDAMKTQQLANKPSIASNDNDHSDCEQSHKSLKLTAESKTAKLSTSAVAANKSKLKSNIKPLAITITNAKKSNRTAFINIDTSDSSNEQEDDIFAFAKTKKSFNQSSAELTQSRPMNAAKATTAVSSSSSNTKRTYTHFKFDDDDDADDKDGDADIFAFDFGGTKKKPRTMAPAVHVEDEQSQPQAQPQPQPPVVKQNLMNVMKQQLKPVQLPKQQNVHGWLHKSLDKAERQRRLQAAAQMSKPNDIKDEFITDEMAAENYEFAKALKDKVLVHEFNVNCSQRQTTELANAQPIMQFTSTQKEKQSSEDWLSQCMSRTQLKCEAPKVDANCKVLVHTVRVPLLRKRNTDSNWVSSVSGNNFKAFVRKQHLRTH